MTIRRVKFNDIPLNQPMKPIEIDFNAIKDHMPIVTIARVDLMDDTPLMIVPDTDKEIEARYMAKKAKARKKIKIYQKEYNARPEVKLRHKAKYIKSKSGWLGKQRIAELQKLQPDHWVTAPPPPRKNGPRLFDARKRNRK